MVYWLVKYLCEEKDWKTFTQMFFFFLKLFVLLFSSTTFLLKTFCYSFCRKKINGTCKKLCLSFLILITSSKGPHSLNYQGWNKVQATFLSHKSTFETVSSRIKNLIFFQMRQLHFIRVILASNFASFLWQLSFNK